MKHVLLLGAKGMLGQEVLHELNQVQIEVLPYDKEDADICDLDFELTSNEWVINCAAFTAVDAAESNRQEAVHVNASGPHYLAGMCAEGHPKLLHISTDYVFEGSCAKPLLETDPTGPLSVYGITKLQGEQFVQELAPEALILRTSWLFGPGGNCFPKTMIRRRSQHEPTKVVADQFGSPTSAIALAKQIVQAIQLDIEPGLYHAGGPEGMSWHEFALRIWREYEALYGLPPMDMEPISTDQYPTPAKRPKYTVLNSSKLIRAGVHPMPPLAESIREFVARVAPEFPPES